MSRQSRPPWRSVLEGPEAKALADLARSSRQHAWWYDYAGTMPKWFAGYVAVENDAAQLPVYDITLVNRLLQTPAYARALISADHPEEPPDKIEERVDLRIARQQVLDRPNPPRLWVVMDEAVLCRPIGGAAAMDINEPPHRAWIQWAGASAQIVAVEPEPFLLIGPPTRINAPVVGNALRFARFSSVSRRCFSVAADTA